MNAIDLTGTQADIDIILAMARDSDAVEEVSDPTSLDASRALNAGLTIAAIGAALTFITIVFKTGTAALEFMKAVREEMKARQAQVAVADAATGKPIGRIEATTPDEALIGLTVS